MNNLSACDVTPGVQPNAHQVNLRGVFLTMKSCLPAMMRQRSGSIIAVASVQGLVASNEGASAYNATKGGVVLLCKNVATDYGKLGEPPCPKKRGKRSWVCFLARPPQPCTCDAPATVPTAPYRR